MGDSRFGGKQTCHNVMAYFKKTMMLFLHLWLETNLPWNTDLFKLGIAVQKFLPSLIHFCRDILDF